MGARFISHKKEVIAAVDEAIDRALEICGGTAERHAVDNIERNHSVRSSTLVNSITHEKRDKDTVAVGTDVYYAPFVELGHHQQPGRYVPAIKKRLKASFVPGKPYLRPAVEDHKAEYEKIFQTELKK